MARPIRETPVLKGEDANTFILEDNGRMKCNKYLF